MSPTPLCVNRAMISVQIQNGPSISLFSKTPLNQFNDKFSIYSKNTHCKTYSGKTTCLSYVSFHYWFTFCQYQYKKSESFVMITRNKLSIEMHATVYKTKLENKNTIYTSMYILLRDTSIFKIYDILVQKTQTGSV